MFEFGVAAALQTLHRRSVDAQRRARHVWAVSAFATLLLLATMATNKAVVSCLQDSNQIQENNDESEFIGAISRNQGSTMEKSTKNTTLSEMEKATTNKAEVQSLQPDHMDEILEHETPDTSDGQAVWRTFEFPLDRVLLFGCSGDEFTVRIRPRLEGFEEHWLRLIRSDLPDSCLRPGSGTLARYTRRPEYQALYWALPGEEHLVPVPMPVLRADMEPVREEAPEAFALSAGVVAFLRSSRGRWEIHIMARHEVGFLEVSEAEVAGHASQPLNPHMILFDENARNRTN